MSNKKNNTSRRTFLKGAATAAAITAPYFVPGRALGLNGAVPASERITIATIGAGGMGNGNTRGFMRNNDAQVVAVCDVDSNRLRDTAKRVNKHSTRAVKS